MGTNCAPLVADLIPFCYERDLLMSLSDDKQADVIDAFNTTSRYLDDILNINNVNFDNMVSQIYPSELQLSNVCLFVALRPKSTAMVMAGRSVQLTTLFPGQA